jgi:Fur family transcriptional regulator, ferric uptake regulator
VHLDESQGNGGSGGGLDDLRIVEPLCAVFRRTLKAEGLKYTPERAQILDAIMRREGVFQADELLTSMKQAGFRVSKATIYRTIKLLADSGIVQQVLVDSEQSHYLLAYGRGSTALIVDVDSRTCEAVDVPELASLRDRLCAERGLAAEGHRLVIYARAR